MLLGLQLDITVKHETFGRMKIYTQRPQDIIVYSHNVKWRLSSRETLAK